MTKEYAEHKLQILIRDHNSYRKMKYTAAVNDYRKAMDNLIFVANRKGYNLGYSLSKAGYAKQN